MDVQETPDSEERVVLGRRAPESWVGFQWSGNEPEGLSDIPFAEALGAVWEGDELVVYNFGAFAHAIEHARDGYQYDPD